LQDRHGGLNLGRWLGMMLVLTWGFAIPGADLKEAEQQYLRGDYKGCITATRQELKSRPAMEDWNVLLSQALLATGQYPEALQVMTNALAENSWGIRLRWQAYLVFQANGRTQSADDMLERIRQMVLSQGTGARDSQTLVAYGQAALLKRSDPKSVLDLLFDPAKAANPTNRDVYLAIGNLALDKHDYALAAKRFEEGLLKLPDDPDLHCGLARAFAPSDPALMLTSVEAALRINSNHVDSLLLLVDHSIDAEEYAQAERLLNRIQAVNPWHPEAWAYRAVVAHLQSQPQAEEKARQTALKYWPTNPRVDYLIGRKLSQNYRFTEGAAHQRQALRFDTNSLVAKAQLAQDLLRLGEEAEGWRLAQEVQKRDAYDVEVFNLTTLHDTMSKFTTLTNREFVVRMGSREAALYGAQVMELLGQARSNVCARYGLEPKSPTIVEVFPEQKDFAVRTFGMPGNPGYLGVCFGSVVTANSPAVNMGHPVNWQAVLWHEFCHVVTLQMTHNKMPRWLSEGISVYEESQANPTWGQRMTPAYREMILGGELTPVSKLSSAFLSPRSALYLQFAYYESSMVVEFIVKQYGIEKLKAILRDLGEGAEINQSIEKHTAAMSKIEEEFAAYAKHRAEQLAPGLDWEKPNLTGPLAARAVLDLGTNAPAGGTNTTIAAPSMPAVLTPERVEEVLAKWIEQHPTNYYALTEKVKLLMEQKDYRAAKAPLQKLIELYPDQTGPESAYEQLATVHRELGETNAERAVLAKLAERDAEAKSAYLRLMELAAATQDWPELVRNARRFLAVDPLVPPPYRFLAQASEHTGESSAAITAYRALLQLDPPDPAQTHFLLAQALHRVGDPGARRQVLEALEEAPRYQPALKLLLDLSKESVPAKTNAPTASGARQ
jgi:tetratricopeptide (TPR) repeat protein